MRSMTMRFVLPVEIKKEGKWYVASCPVLDVHSQGRTPEKAMANIREALRLFLETCYEMGTLDEVLREAGLHVARRAAPEKSARSVEVPIRLAA